MSIRSFMAKPQENESTTDSLKFESREIISLELEGDSNYGKEIIRVLLSTVVLDLFELWRFNGIRNNI